MPDEITDRAGGAPDLAWLVRNRSRNQQTTLELYELLIEHRLKIDTNVSHNFVIQQLSAVAFSLWRAVFLSNILDTPEAQLVDVGRFLETLISNNAIGYTQDQNAREWTFPYYLDNAKLRLRELAANMPGIVDFADTLIEADSAKEDWEVTHHALEAAIARFATTLATD